MELISPPTFKADFDFYLERVIRNIFSLFEIHISELHTKHIYRKLNILSYGIYLLRLLATGPCFKLSLQNWKILVDGVVVQIRYYQTNKHVTTSKFKHRIEERIIHPLIHCLFESFALLPASDPKTANALLRQYKKEISTIKEFEPVSVQRTMTLRIIISEILNLTAPTYTQLKEQRKFMIKSTFDEIYRSKTIPNQQLQMDQDLFVFNIDERLQQLMLDVLEFDGIDRAFLILGRLLYLLEMNPVPSTEQISSDEVYYKLIIGHIFSFFNFKSNQVVKQIGDLDPCIKLLRFICSSSGEDLVCGAELRDIITQGISEKINKIYQVRSSGIKRAEFQMIEQKAVEPLIRCMYIIRDKSGISAVNASLKSITTSSLRDIAQRHSAAIIQIFFRGAYQRAKYLGNVSDSKVKKATKEEQSVFENDFIYLLNMSIIRGINLAQTVFINSF